jgi:hypothetical protein
MSISRGRLPPGVLSVFFDAVSATSPILPRTADSRLRPRAGRGLTHGGVRGSVPGAPPQTPVRGCAPAWPTWPACLGGRRGPRPGALPQTPFGAAPRLGPPGPPVSVGGEVPSLGLRPRPRRGLRPLRPGFPPARPSRWGEASRSRGSAPDPAGLCPCTPAGLRPCTPAGLRPRPRRGSDPAPHPPPRDEPRIPVRVTSEGRTVVRSSP